MNTLDYPPGKTMRLLVQNTSPRHGILLIPFAGYRLRLYNATLDYLGEVSRFLLSVAGQTPLKPLLPQLGLTALQRQDLLQRLRQLDLLDAESQLTTSGQAAAQLLNQGLQGKIRLVWLEQSLKEGTPVGLQPVTGDPPDLQPRDHWPDHWPSLPLFDGRSAAQQQKRRWRGHRRSDQHKANTDHKAAAEPAVTQLFPEAEEALNTRFTALPLDIAFEATQQVRYYALTVPLPGHDALWQPLDGNDLSSKGGKALVFAWPWASWVRYHQPIKQDGTPWPMEQAKLTLTRRYWRLDRDALDQHLAAALDSRDH